MTSATRLRPRDDALRKPQPLSPTLPRRCSPDAYDPATAPACELAALYHERWEAEVLFAEIKVTLPGRRLMLRSRRADLVEQEVYGLLLVHFALRHLMVQAAQALGTSEASDPDTLSFLHTVRVVRCHLPLHAAFSPSAAPADAGGDPG